MTQMIRFAEVVLDVGAEGLGLTQEQILEAAKAAHSQNSDFHYGVAEDEVCGTLTKRVSFELVGTGNMRFVLCDEEGAFLVLRAGNTYSYIQLVLVNCRQNCRAPAWCTHPRDVGTLQRVRSLIESLQKLLLEAAQAKAENPPAI